MKLFAGVVPSPGGAPTTVVRHVERWARPSGSAAQPSVGRRRVVDVGAALAARGVEQ